MIEQPRYLIVDVGSTTTKALLIEPVDGEYRLTRRGEAATTVEAPAEDVMIGVRRAVAELGMVVDCPASSDDQAEWLPPDLQFLATSSAGGGLQVLVCGQVRSVTAESAERAALGAGAVLLDVFSSDDRRPVFQRMEALRRARPDMVLLAGGVDGGQSVDFAVEFCDLLNSARPRPRFGQGYRLPVIYAGNSLAAPLVQDTLDDTFQLTVVPNLRPSLDQEDLQPTRQRIHELFLSHVMERAPGYQRLQQAASAPILPTPLAVGRILTRLAEREAANILAADIGGATTDIFSVVDGRFDRTVSANLGMSYSAGNVLASAGLEQVQRWLPFTISPGQLRDLIGNKVINPASIPETVVELLVEQAVAREALRLSWEQHLRLTIELPGERSRLQQAFSSQSANFLQRQRRLDLRSVQLIIGSGGVLSHAPARGQAALMLLDAFQPLGYTFLAVDSVFMLPHLGALSQRDLSTALHVLDRDCLTPLGPSVSLLGAFPAEASGQPALSFRLHSAAGTQAGTVNFGSLRRLTLPPGASGRLELRPLADVDVGAGRNASLELEVPGGVVGVLLDCRGRPLPQLTATSAVVSQRSWHLASGALLPEQLPPREVSL